MELSRDDKLHFRDLLQQKPLLGQVFECAKDNVPVVFDMKANAEPASVALKAAYAEGWRECLNFILKECTEINEQQGKSGFTDMSEP